MKQQKNCFMNENSFFHCCCIRNNALKHAEIFYICENRLEKG